MERPPRLVLRFAVLTAVCVGAATAAIVVFTRDVNLQAAKREAARHATFIAKTVLSQDVRASDLAHAATGARRKTLDHDLGRLLGSLGTGGQGDANGIIPALAISIAGPDGVVTYSTDHRLIGTRLPAARVADALSGYTSSLTSTSPPGQTRDGRSHPTLDAYAPLALRGGGRGVAEISLDGSAISATASTSFYPIAGILEGAVIVMYLLLVPLLARVSRRLRRQMERINHQAHHDELTGLANRLHYSERARAEIARLGAGERLATLIVDLDRFKEINDTLGHQAGDTLLRQVAIRLRQQHESRVVVARLGGDEFGLLARVAGCDEAQTLAEGVNEVLRQNFLIDDIPVAVEASVGVAVCPDHGDDIDTLMAKADIAMYEAKSRHAGSVLYEPGADVTHEIEVSLLAELRRALDEREIVLHYQPKVDLRSSAITGVEALVRWQHPERGLIPPDGFLPYAERTGVNRSLTRYVLETALIQLRSWREQDLEVSTAVNVTVFDLLDPGFAGEVSDLLRTTGVAPGLLELEITETEIMSDVARVRATLERLRELGVRIAIDDFGSGYSSLAYLKTLPVDTLKIDRAFVTRMADDPRDRAVVHTAVALAHTFGLSTVAEGIETPEAWNLLQAAGCDVAQGFLIGQPAPAGELTALLRRGRRAPRAA